LPARKNRPADAGQPSGPEFVKSVLDLHPKVAVFDCDGTLWGGDSGQDFLYWEIDRGLVSADVARRALPRYADYKAGKVAEDVMCGEMVTLHQGIPEARMLDAAEEFFRDVVAMRIFTPMQELTMELASKGCKLWAVSSTNDWVVRAGVRRFGIPQGHVLAACVAIENGCASGRLLRVPTGEGKADALRQVIPGGRPDVAFGNTLHDAAMLELARHAFAINPEPELETLARQRGWRVYFPPPLSSVKPENT
jgi:phosphoserine phosphatase